MTEKCLYFVEFHELREPRVKSPSGSDRDLWRRNARATATSRAARRKNARASKPRELNANEQQI